MPRCPFLLLVYLVLGLLSQCGLGLAHLLVRNIAFQPKFLPDLKADDTATIMVEVAYYYQPGLQKKLSQYNLSLDAVAADPAIARLAYRSERLQWNPESIIGQADDDDDEDGIAIHRVNTTGAPGDLTAPLASLRVAYHRTNLTIDALFLGKTEAAFAPRLVSDKEEQEVEVKPVRPLDTFPVIVMRSSHARMLNAIFLSTLGCLIIIANVMMGCELNLDVVRDVIKRPIAPSIGFATQFLLMPAISYTLARVLLVPYGYYSLGLGLFTAGCAPGGGASNFWTVLLDGNTDLSITMTFISTIAALGMMPLWMLGLGSHFLVDRPGTEIKIPYKNILISLSILVGPLLIGMAVRKWCPKVATYIRKVMRPFLIMIIVFIVTFGTYANLYMFRLMSWQVLTGGLLLPFIGFWLGCFAALATRQTKENVAAIAIETGVQNSGIAIMLLKMSFPEPDGDIGSVAPVVVSIFTPGPLLLGYSVHLLMKWFKVEKRRGLCEGLRGEELEDFRPLQNADSNLTDSYISKNGFMKENNNTPLNEDKMCELDGSRVVLLKENGVAHHNDHKLPKL